MLRFHQLAFALVIAGLLTPSPASAALQYYHFVFSGAAYEAAPNTAKAEGTFVLDDSVFTNPGNFTSFAEITGAMVDVTMTVSGASAGNGTFGAADFVAGYNVVIADALDLSTEWVGQAQPTSGTTWGDYKLNGSDTNDLNFFGEPPDDLGNLPSRPAPIGAGPFVLKANAGVGDPMALVSVTPVVPEELNVGEVVSNVSGAIVSRLNPASISTGGRLFLRSEINGTGVISANAACLLSWDRYYFLARAILRAGDPLSGASIKSFGDPVANGSNLIFKANLALDGTVKKNNNEVIASIAQSGDASTLIGLLREGDGALIPGDLHFKKFTWFHGIPGSMAANSSAVVNGAGPIASDGSGAFIGALVANRSGKTKGHGCWFSDGTTVTPIVFSGGPVVIDGETKTVKTVSNPTVIAPAQAEGRVGNATAISLLIKTVDGVTAIKTFDAPVSVITLAAKTAVPAPPATPAKARYGNAR